MCRKTRHKCLLSKYRVVNRCQIRRQVMVDFGEDLRGGVCVTDGIQGKETEQRPDERGCWDYLFP